MSMSRASRNSAESFQKDSRMSASFQKSPVAFHLLRREQESRSRRTREMGPGPWKVRAVLRRAVASRDPLHLLARGTDPDYPARSAGPPPDTPSPASPKI